LSKTQSEDKRVESSLVACLDESSILSDSTVLLTLLTKTLQIIRFAGFYVLVHFAIYSN